MENLVPLPQAAPPASLPGLGSSSGSVSTTSTSVDIVTADGGVVHPGDRVFSFGDGKWGVIVEAADYCGVFQLRHEDGTEAFVNGDGISAHVPQWMVIKVPPWKG